MSSQTCEIHLFQQHCQHNHNNIYNMFLRSISSFIYFKVLLQSSRSDCCWLAGYQIYLRGDYLFGSLHLHRRFLHSPHQEVEGTSSDDRLDRNVGRILMLRHLYTREGTDVGDSMKKEKKNKNLSALAVLFSFPTSIRTLV